MNDAASIAVFDPTDPYQRRAQTFAKLDADMLDRASRYGSNVELPSGTFLFERGQRHNDFFIVRSGSVEILELDEDSRYKVVTVHQEYEFTGELDLFSARETLVSARVVEPGQFIRVCRSAFQRLLRAEADIAEIIIRAFILRRLGFLRHGQAGVLVVGPESNTDVLRLQRFLFRNGYPYRVVDSEREIAASQLRDTLQLESPHLPLVIIPGGRVLRNPTTAEVADALGIAEVPDPSCVYDVAVVGAGPAGLAAAVYAASEGLSTIVLEGLAPGGQAGTSSRIENYLGFPNGISGQALAERAQAQAQRFGAKLVVSRMARRLEVARDAYQIWLDGDQCVKARAIVVASGARYRNLDVINASPEQIAGIHFAATAMEARLCVGQDIVVVGGGNSAGQAAIFLAQYARHVSIVVRGPHLAATMSDYLIQRITRSSRITLHTHTEVVGLSGARELEQVTLEHRPTGKCSVAPARQLFLMIGAAPNSEWLAGWVALDRHGYVLTGAQSGSADASPYETNRPGIYAVGDIRSGSVKRVASGVGEGSVVVQSIHQFLIKHATGALT